VSVLTSLGNDSSLLVPSFIDYSHADNLLFSPLVEDKKVKLIEHNRKYVI